jgi:uncharacterized membrane protein
MLTWLFTKTPLFFLIQPFWRDEAFSYFMAKKNILEMLLLTAKDFNPPLYYFILHFWMNIFGNSEIALRSLSLLFFWGTICIVFLFLNNIFKLKERKSSIYLILFIINPLFLYYAFEARMYSMFAFFATLSFYAFFKKNNRLYLISTVAGLFTHYFMILVVISQLLFLIINKNTIDYIKRKTVYIALIIFAPWLIFFLSQNHLSSSFWIDKPHLRDILGILGIIYTGNETAFYSGSISLKMLNNATYISIFLTTIFLIGIYLYKKIRQKKEKLNLQLLFIWGIGIPIFVGLISFIKPIYFPRYLIFATVGFLFLIIFILEKINLYLRAILFTTLIVLTFNYQKLQIEFRKKIDIKKPLKEIEFISNKNDFIYTDDLDFFTTQYYLKNRHVYIYGKNYEDIPAYNGKVLIYKKNVTNNLPFYPQKAFIINSDGQYTIESTY